MFIVCVRFIVTAKLVVINVLCNVLDYPRHAHVSEFNSHNDGLLPYYVTLSFYIICIDNIIYSK